MLTDSQEKINQVPEIECLETLCHQFKNKNVTDLDELKAFNNQLIEKYFNAHGASIDLGDAVAKFVVEFFQTELALVNAQLSAHQQLQLAGAEQKLRIMRREIYNRLGEFYLNFIPLDKQLPANDKVAALAISAFKTAMSTFSVGGRLINFVGWVPGKLDFPPTSADSSPVADPMTRGVMLRPVTSHLKSQFSFNGLAMLSLVHHEEEYRAKFNLALLYQQLIFSDPKKYEDAKKYYTELRKLNLQVMPNLLEHIAGQLEVAEDAVQDKLQQCCAILDNLIAGFQRKTHLKREFGSSGHVPSFLHEFKTVQEPASPEQTPCRAKKAPDNSWSLKRMLGFGRS